MNRRFVPNGNVRLNNVGMMIFQAAKVGDVEALKMCLHRPEVTLADLSFEDENGQTPLSVAAMRGHLTCVKIVIAYTSVNVFSCLRLDPIAKCATKKVATYLNLCKGDLKRFKTTRAHVEIEASKIAEKLNCSAQDVQRFVACVDFLVKECDYIFDESSEDCNWILRATRSNNISIVKRLVEDYKASLHIRVPKTQQNLLHIACIQRSPLRYYLASKCPTLLLELDAEGDTPLHTACKADDTEFVSWLFQVHRDVCANGEEALPPDGAVECATMPDTKESCSCTRSLQPQGMEMPSHLLPKSDSIEVMSNDPCGMPDGVTDGGTTPSKTVGRQAFSFQRAPIYNRRHLHFHSLNKFLKKSRTTGAISEKRFYLGTMRVKYQSSNECIAMQEGEDPHCGHQGGLDKHHNHNEHQGRCCGEHHDECQCGCHRSACQEESFHPFAYPRDVTDLISINNSGHSPVHIAVAHGYTRLLSTLLGIVSRSVLQESFDAICFLSRNNFPNGTPVDLAIINSQDSCLRQLLQFFESVGLLMTLSLDDKLLKTATFIGNPGTVKLLIEFGISGGLEQAISQAIANNFRDILRLLLFYYTQLTNLQEGMSIAVLPSGHQTGEVRWKGIAIEELKAEWLVDCYSAIGSVHKARHEALDVLDNSCLQRCLGVKCLKHFDEFGFTQSTFQSLHEICLLVAITNVEICESGLTSVPPELFQMPHLTTLTLEHNSISELPSALNSSGEEVYTCRSLKKLVLDGNQLSRLPEDLFLGLVCTLEELSVQRNRLTDLPPGVWVMPHLKTLRLSGNMLSRLHYFCCKGDSSPGPRVCPMVLGAQVRLFYHTLCKAAGWNIEGDFNDEAITCEYQKAMRVLSEKLLAELEEEVGGAYEGMLGGSSHLLNVDLSFNHFSGVPRELPCIAPMLQRLNMKHNFIVNTDLVHDLPASVTTVNLDYNQLESTTQCQGTVRQGCASCWMLLYQTAAESPAPCQHTAHDCLQKLVVLTLGNNHLKDFVVGEGSVGSSSSCLESAGDGAPPPYTKLYFPQLSILELPNNGLKCVPRCLHQIDTLNSLDLSFNTSIQSLPGELGLFKQDSLSVLKLDGLTINGVPEHILCKPSPRALINYLRTTLLHSKPYRCIKLMLMGSVRAGKTTLLQQLTKRGTLDRRKEVEMGFNGEPLSTVGVDLGDWVYRPQKGSPKVTFMTWDFGGQEEYYATHQCFLSDRSLYLVVWDANDGKKGLEAIKPWLENIEARAPGAPVIVVGTHSDCINQDEKKRLEELFEQWYINYDPSQFAYPSIEPSCQFVNCFDVMEINHLRDLLYDKATKYKRTGAAHGWLKTTPTPLLDEPVPMSFIKLHDTVRSLAKGCRDSGAIPILHREDYYDQVEVNSFLGKAEELEQATSFLHENGILLHYEDSQLSDLYFIDPQWLCSMLAKVITIQEKNPYQKNGLMLVQDMDKIFTDSTTKPFIKDLIKMMQKFEVLLLLDEQHLLIPSLLPTGQELACVVSIKSSSPNGDSIPSPPSSLPSTSFSLPSPSSLPTTSSSLSNHPPASTLPSSSFPNTLIRYQFLHFIPNGFFSRLIARVVSGPILGQCSEWLLWPWPLEEGMALEGPRWHCWRSGLKLVWNHVEILKIVPVDCPLPGDKECHIISSQGQQKMELPKAIKIVVGVPPSKCMTSQATPEQLSSWILQQGTNSVASVFEDWYEQYGRNRDMKLTFVSPCQLCKKTIECTTSSQEQDRMMAVQNQCAYFFSSPYCALMVAERRSLECPIHGKLSVGDIAPDLVFRDFVPSMVFDSTCIIKSQMLGEGGFGAVFAGCIKEENTTRHVAVKELTPRGLVDGNEQLLAELTAWEIYQSACQEARVMYRLSHENVLRLLGVSLAPIRLLLELAPLGDLKACVQKFQQVKVKLSRATLQSTMIQVAGALDYLHSQSFIYRDLKPGNVLVWKFPLPETQWTGDQAVQLKLADYGISQQFTPQGVRGLQGTPPYLPPEVLLHGGLETYSTKLDVYSFGMFMYFLFTFSNPFEKETRSIASLLEAGRRPELMPKHHPGSLWMIELMCWCWSEKPQHRPTFQEILGVLCNGTLMKLLSGFPATQSSEEVVAACTKLSFGSSPQHSAITEDTMDVLGHHGDFRAHLEVWYGCDGQLNVVEYLPTGVTVQTIETFEARVSSICITGTAMWVATVGAGLHVYSATTRRKVGRWEGSSKVFKLVSIEHTSCVLAVTPTTIHCLSLVPGHTQSSAVILDLQATGILEESFKSGCALAVVTGTTTSEVWLASEQKLLILNTSDLTTIACLDHTWKKVRFMETMVVADKITQVVIADEHYLEKWAVNKRAKVQVLDCHKACVHEYGSNTKLSCITSLLSFNGLLYVGTQGGIILTLEPSQLMHLSTLHTCNGPSTCLLGVKPALKVRSIARLFSVRKTRDNSTEHVEVSTGSGESTEWGGGKGGAVLAEMSGADSTCGLPLVMERSVIVSFGREYRGVTSHSVNCPPALNGPGVPPGGSNSAHLSYLRYLSPQPSNFNHLFLWSADCSRGMPG